MPAIEQVVPAIAPDESQRTRQQARAKAQSAARPGDWLSLVLVHHRRIEQAFAAAQAATTDTERRRAVRALAIVLTGHATAEESVLYPALVLHREKGRADMGYSEQATVKTEMAALERLEPLSGEHAGMLEHIRKAVAHHMYEEEHAWFLELHGTLYPAEQATLTNRYREEFDRYVGTAPDPTTPTA